MNKRIKKLWIEALTSGEYKQGKHALRKGDRFCCLGVLCDLYRKEKGGQWKRVTLASGQAFHDEEATLPEKVRKWAKLEDDNPAIDHPKYDCLAEANDAGVKFPRIADLIEKYL